MRKESTSVLRFVQSYRGLSERSPKIKKAVSLYNILYRNFTEETVQSTVVVRRDVEKALVLWRLFVFIYFDSKAGAHPAADAAGIAFLGICENREQVALGRELVCGHRDAPAGAEFDAVAASFADCFVDYYLAFSHLSLPIVLLGQAPLLAVFNLYLGVD